MTETKKSEWNSNLAFMMAMIGSAVGLGNIWRFPNVLYSNGGGSFMIPYIVSLFLLGISFVLVEYAVGFKFKKSIARILFSVSKKLEPVAWFILLIVFLITTYYVCVVGWDFIYIILSLTKAWGANPDLYFANNVLHATDSMSGLFTIVPNVLVSVFIIWFLAWFIIKRDLNDGIGNVSKILLPLLCAIVVIIVAFSLTLPGASVGYTQIFTPDWSALTNLDVWLAAFGQIVFSLSLGMAIAMTYASYLPEGSKLVDNAIIVAFSNSGFEVFNSIGIFSILGFMTVTSGIPFNELVTEGTGLAFVVFPQVFNTMGGAAYIIGPLFFLCILFAGITSVIALLEGVCYSISEKFLIERKKTATVVCIIGFLISCIFATGAGSTILGIFDVYLNNFALLFAILLECIIFGWVYKFDDLIETLNNNSSIKVGKTWKAVIKYILPICIFGLWAQGVYSTIFTADGLSRTVMLILTILLIVIPFIFAKLPAINKEYYNV
ncbi:MAG: sodium-dependent transporter [Methanobrevibacter sp.]|uniref:sodium-dependent transporter n=1 Tax=Methanobrevibacter sp. TaxID=66852 RepID=UPI0025D397F1|nr:sodium-dependent transporter [Methanobrevibacter sp.]MBQ8018542.1 sodium-dependent transporter [Methanobrevibacter sp.]MBR1610883.1 sodium-dependent transporter [Methanobrevibacter sp.]